MNKKILIVEDSKSYLFIISQTLRDEGFMVATAENGKKGLEAIKDSKPDLILCDITMPEMNGLEMSAEVKKLYPDIPIIFLTNMSDEKNISKGMENAVDYVVKADVSVEDIVKRVKEKLAS